MQLLRNNEIEALKLDATKKKEAHAKAVVQHEGSVETLGKELESSINKIEAHKSESIMQRDAGRACQGRGRTQQEDDLSGQGARPGLGWTR
ncbi:hypothetical protein THAOC_23525 [Thalassiosira oceanica]|uniref:Uncharacterized protein n=1 Tax=Thalassiosira oceanica TaxID=159749 RepID=K0S6P2_THAOC|nr:hypothetical protein THAOC_23525 [Thalassiosira oceanica]|eukprot:EJK56566.1 hypothetical protein THAOC_23525 [Thalassiosira oceanica]